MLFDWNQLDGIFPILEDLKVWEVLWDRKIYLTRGLYIYMKALFDMTFEKLKGF